MAGTAPSEIVWASVVESTVDTTPATPAFIKSSLEIINFNALPNIREQRQQFAGRRVSSISRSGYTITGNGNGPLVYGEYDNLLASLLQNDWASDVLKDGLTDTNSLTFEQTLPQGAGGTNSYQRFTGVEAAGMTLRLEAEQDARVEFDFLGRTSVDATETAITGATYADPTNTNVLGSGADVGFLTLGALTVPCLRSAELSVTMQDKERQPRVGSDSLCGIQRGACLPVLTGEFYIEDEFLELYNAHRAGTEIAVTMPLGSVTGEKYTVELPAAEIVEGPVNMSEANVFQNLRIIGKYDETEDCALKITRAVA